MSTPSENYIRKQDLRTANEDPINQQVEEIESRRVSAQREKFLQSANEFAQSTDAYMPVAEVSAQAETTGVTLGQVGSYLWDTWDESIMRAIAGINKMTLERLNEPLKEAGVEQDLDESIQETDKFIRRMSEEITSEQPVIKGQPGMQWLMDLGTAGRDMLPGVAASVVTKNPWSFAMFAAPQVMGNQYVRRRLAGEDPSAARRGALYSAAIEVATERVPMGEIVRQGVPATRKILTSLFAEGAQEMGTSLLQSVYDKATIEPEKTLNEIVWDALYEGSLGAAMGAGFATATSTIDRALGARIRKDRGITEDRAQEVEEIVMSGPAEPGLSYQEQEYSLADLQNVAGNGLRKSPDELQSQYEAIQRGEYKPEQSVLVEVDDAGNPTRVIEGNHTVAAMVMNGHKSVTVRTIKRSEIEGLADHVQKKLDEADKRQPPKMEAGDKQNRTDTERMVQTAGIQKVPLASEHISDKFYEGIDEETRAKYKERVWSVDLRRFEEPGDIVDTIRQLGTTHDNPKQTIPWEETKEAARKLARNGGMDEDAVISWSREQGLNTSQLEAAGMILLDSAQRVRDAQKYLKARKDGGTLTNADRIAFRELIGRHAGIMQSYSGMASEAGRSLNILKSVSARSGNYAGAINDMINTLGGEKVTDDLIDALSDMDSVAAMNTFLRHAHKVTARDMIHQTWLAGLLSGLRTQEVNFVGSGLATVALNVERLAAGVIGDAKTGAAALFRRTSSRDSASVREQGAALYGSIRGLIDGVRLMGKAFKTGQSSVDNEIKLEDYGTGGKRLPRGAVNPALTTGNLAALVGKKPPTGTFAKALDFFFEYSPVGGRLPFHLMVAGDDFWKSINYRTEFHVQAYRKAKKIAKEMGRDDDAFIAQQIEKITQEVPEDVHQAAITKAREATFTGKPTGTYWEALERVARGLRHFPLVGKYIVPFVNTPVNIMKFAFQRSPLAGLDPDVLADIRAGGARQETALARIALGSSLMALGGLLANSGLLTGGGPGDEKQGLREAVRRRGVRPRSLRIPADFFGPGDPATDQFYDISRTDPVGLFLTIVGDTYDVMKWADDDATRDEIAASVAIATAESFTNETYLKGVSDFFDAWVSDPKRYANYWVNQMAGSFVPNIVNDVNRHFFDRTRRQVDNVLDAWRARIPGLSKDLPPQRTLWGDEVTDPDFNMFTPVQTSEIRITDTSALDHEIVRNRWNIERPSPILNNLDLRDFEIELKDGTRRNAYERYLELQGRIVTDGQGNNLVQALNDLIRAPGYQLGTSGPDGTKYGVFKTTINAYRELAKMQLLQEFPALAEKSAEVDQKMQDAKTKGVPGLDF